MTKQTLLAAVATAALGLSAFGAQANDLSITVGGQPVNAAPLKIASEAPFNTNALRTAEVVATVDYDSTTFPAGNNLVVTYTLGGGAVFNAAVLAADLVGFDEVIISSGGGIGSNQVVFLIDNANDSVDTGDFTGLRITTDVRFAAGSTSPTVTINTKTEANTPIEGGDAAPVGVNSVLITRATGFEFDIVAATSANEAKIAADYEAFDDGATDFVAELGSIEINYAPGVYSGFVSGAAVTVATTDPFNSAAVTIGGTLTNLDIVDTAGADTTPAGSVLTINQTGLGDIIPVELELGGVASASEYTASIVMDLDSGWTETNPAATGDLNEITREGTSYMVAWVSSGTLSAANSTNNVIRISNESELDAAVLLEVTSSATVGGIAPAFTAGIVPAGTVPAGGELVLSSATLQTLLGGDFRRADVRVIVEAESDVINVLRQVIQPNNQASELSVAPE